MQRGILAGALAALSAAVSGPAFAQDTIRVEVRVTFASGDSVYLDKGRSSGLDTGDVVVLQDPTRGRLKAELTVVSTTTARAVMRDGQVPPEPGVRGEILIPADRLGEEAPEGPKKPGPGEEVPEHPPWEREEGPRKPDEPLLVPAFHKPRTEREAEWHGRFWTHLLTNIEREGNDARYSLGQVGTDLTGTNLFGAGGLFRIRMAAEQRTIDVDGGRDDSDGDFRIDRFAYEWGGGYDSPILVKIGRFLPRDTPELGLVDGLEATYDIGVGRLGFDVGAFPEPLPDRESFDDVGATLSWRLASGENDELVTLLAWQQTWHDGDRDRSLALGRLSWAPNREFSFFGSSWIDHYDGGDEIKDSGFELTEAHLNAAWRFHPDHRARVGFTHVKWPEIERNEFPDLVAEILDDNRVNRFDLSTDHDLAEHLELDARIGRWADEDDDGVTGHLRLRFPDALADDLTTSVTAFRTDGTTSDGHGLRLNARRSFGGAWFSVGYEVTKRDVTGFDQGSESFTQHAVLANVDFVVGRSWNASVNADYRFGDAQDALSLGLFVQYRF